jgi:hypothetical protein
MLQQMPGIEPVTIPNPPEETKTCMWLLCVGDVRCTRSCAMSAALVPRSCNQGCGRCAHQLSERANASNPCLYINHKPLETNKNVVVEACRGGSVAQSVWRGKWRGCVWQAPYFKVREPLQTCTPCFHTSRTSFPRPEFCNELSIVCALMACYVLESSECESRGQIYIRASACSG